MTFSKRFSQASSAVFLCATLSWQAVAADGGGAFEFFAEEAKVQPLLGTLTVTNAQHRPVSITTITRDQIDLTPARNIEDLIEVYVPGAIVLNHFEGTTIGMRGVAADRNLKFLLLVNGRKVNLDAHAGAITELENWDLSDIEKIEVIRGPGSVTFGPGAISGVINITTRSAATVHRSGAGAQYVSKYQSKDLYVDGVSMSDRLAVYAHASVTSTRGFQPTKFSTPSSGSTHLGYLGDPAHVPSTYFRDAEGIPQGKLHVELNGLNGWKFWTRASNMGSSMEAGSSTNQALVEGTMRNRYFKTRSAMGVLENSQSFSDFHLNSALSLSSGDHYRFRPSSSGPGTLSKDDIHNAQQSYSETELLAKSTLQYRPHSHYDFAAGVEYSLKKFGPRWGEGFDRFRLGDGSDIVGSPETASAAGVTTAYVYRHGWYANRISGVSEASLGLDPRLRLLLSARIDKHVYAKPTFSPRIATVSDFGDAGILKLIWQRSVRFGTEENLLLAHAAGHSPSLERLESYEIIHEISPHARWMVSNSVFYNTLNALGWNNTTSSTIGLGTQKVMGWEGEAKYAGPRLDVGLNHSYTHQVSYHLSPEISNSFLSYSDYRTQGMDGSGNNVNNYPANATKLFANYKVTSKITVHGDTRIFWNFPGTQDYLDLVRRYWAANGTASQQAQVNAALNEIDAHGGYKIDCRMNAAVRYQHNEHVSINFFVLNILSLTRNKRYGFDSLTTVNSAFNTVPSWVEEPTVWGTRVEYRF